VDIHSAKQKLIDKKLSFVEGWHFRSFDTTERLRQHYQDVFEPAIDKQKFLSAYKVKDVPGRFNIAVHIRRGDYKYYRDGLYHYNDGQYISLLQSFLQVIQSEDVHIVVFSNDRDLPYQKYFQSFRSIAFSKENEFVDYFLMSNCNLIIGPPSTFSLWASYIGEVPYYHIKDPEKPIALKDFEICGG
jgi:hypothetical protein